MPEYLTPDLFKSFQVAKVFKDHSRPVNSMDFDPKGNFLLTCSDDESMRIYTATTGKLHNTVYSKKYGCSLAKFTHRSNNLVHASTKSDDSIRYMSLHDNKYLRYFKGHTGKVVSLELSPIDDTFISASLDNTVKMWDLGSKSHHGVIDTAGLPNPLVAFDPSGLVFALGLGNNSIRMYSFQNHGAGPFLSQFLQDPFLLANPPEWTKLTFSNDGKYLLISTRSNVIYLLDAFKATLIHRLSGHVNSGATIEASFTPDTKYVISGSMDGRVYVWDVLSGNLVSDFIFHTDTPKILYGLLLNKMVLERERHIAYIKSLDTKNKTSLLAVYSAHLRLNALYWGSTALYLLNAIEEVDRESIIADVMECYHPQVGGFGGHKGHDAHLLFTLSAIQVLATFDALDRVEPEAIMNYLKKLQNSDGSFAGDEYGETDTRFSYCAVSCASLLGKLDELNIPLVVSFIASCQNFDGGFGSVPGAESHAGQIFCCVGALAITKSLHILESEDKLAWWLAERQLPNGGLNGRPEKLEDVCYSWWVLSCLCMLKREDWIDFKMLEKFILSAQDEDNGGIADRPGDAVDVFHTLFGICGLSMMGYEGLAAVDPRYCMPLAVTKKLNL